MQTHFAIATIHSALLSQSSGQSPASEPPGTDTRKKTEKPWVYLIRQNIEITPVAQ